LAYSNLKVVYVDKISTYLLTTVRSGRSHRYQR